MDASYSVASHFCHVFAFIDILLPVRSNTRVTFVFVVEGSNANINLEFVEIPESWPALTTTEAAAL